MLGTRGARPLTAVPRDPVKDPLLQRVPQDAHALRHVREPLGREAGRRTQPDDPGNVLRPRPALPLVRPPGHERLDLHATPDKQGADSLGPVNLMPRKRQEVNTKFLHDKRHLPRRLHGVGVEQDAAGRGDPSQLADRLQHPGFVVRMHHRDQDGPVRDRRLDGRRVHASGRVHPQVSHFRPGGLQGLAGSQDRRMLDAARDDVTTPGPPVPENPPERGVVGLRPARRKDNLPGFGADKISDGPPRLFYHRPRLLAERVDRAGVAKRPLEGGKHRLDHQGIGLRRGAVVEVYARFQGAE